MSHIPRPFFFFPFLFWNRVSLSQNSSWSGTHNLLPQPPRVTSYLFYVSNTSSQLSKIFETKKLGQLLFRAFIIFSTFLVRSVKWSWGSQWFFIHILSLLCTFKNVNTQNRMGKRIDCNCTAEFSPLNNWELTCEEWPGGSSLLWHPKTQWSQKRICFSECLSVQCVF